MKHLIVKRFISEERFQAYKSLDEYKENLYFSEQAYMLLSIFEISLRNGIDFYFCYKHSNNWLMGTDILHKNQQLTIQEAKNKISQRKEDITHHKIIAELSFGFWTSLFNRFYHEIMRTGDIKGIFPNLPPRNQNFINRQELNKRLNKIRRFRNRVFHYEKVIDKPEFNNIQDEILTLLSYFDEEIYDFAKSLTK